MNYLFIFGNTPKLSAAELKAVLAKEEKAIGTINEFGCSVELPNDYDIDQLYQRLGGIVKIGRIVGSFKTHEELMELLIKRYSDGDKVTFGISYYGHSFRICDLINISKDLKDSLSSDRKIRYVLPSLGTALAPVVVTKQKVSESLLFETGDETFVAETLFVSDFENWNKRDYGRPGVDAHAGMLPPRVARMMVNLAQISDNGIILDPFCGVGTILSESLMLGYEVCGIDSNLKQVELANSNIQWLINQFKITDGKYQVQKGDSRVVSKIMKGKVDAIVTEPDLGPANFGIKYNVSPTGEAEEHKLRLLSITGKLERLYLDCLEDWKNTLKVGAKIVIVLPSFVSPANQVNNGLVKRIIDKAQSMGYSLDQEPIEYFRPQARVRRNITVFKLT